MGYHLTEHEGWNGDKHLKLQPEVAVLEAEIDRIVSAVYALMRDGIDRPRVLFRLRRYNGRSHQHTNKIEEITFYDFHIHTATERYQDAGYAEEHFAEVTDRYVDFEWGHSWTWAVTRKPGDVISILEGAKHNL